MVMSIGDVQLTPGSYSNIWHQIYIVAQYWTNDKHCCPRYSLRPQIMGK